MNSVDDLERSMRFSLRTLIVASMACGVCLGHIPIVVYCINQLWYWLFPPDPFLYFF